jgi:hypothetical protein
LFWFVSAIVAWDVWGIEPVSGGWLAVAIVAAALIRAPGDGLSGPIDMSEEAADLHPVGAGGQVWPAPTPPRPSRERHHVDIGVDSERQYAS